MSPAPTDQQPAEPAPEAPLSAEARFLYPALIALALFFLCVHTVLDPDCWFHMAFGRALVEDGTFPRADIFSFTSPGNEWISSGWLPSVLLHWAFAALAERGLVALVLIVHCAIWLGIYAAAIRLWGNRGTVVLVLFPAMLAAYLRMTPRPELASHLFLAILLILLSVASRVDRPGAPKAAAAVPFVFALWANCHAGFLAGFAPLGAFVGWQLLLWRWNGNSIHARIAGIAAVGFVAWIANPWGWRITALAGKIEDIPMVDQYVLEWMPLLAAPHPEARMPKATILGLVASSVLGIAALAKARRRPSPWLAVAAAAIIVLAFRERRHIALAGVAAAVAVAQSLDWADAWFAGKRRHILTAFSVAACASAIGLQVSGALVTGGGWPRAKADDSLLPATATRYFKEYRPPANLFNDYGPGGYLLYHLGPETKVFIDGRLDVYDSSVWLDYLALQNMRATPAEIADKYGINTFFVYTQGAALKPDALPMRLVADPQMRVVYFDDRYMIAVRETAETRDWVAKNALRFVHPFMLDNLYRALDDPGMRMQAEAEVARVREMSGDSARSLLIASLAAKRMARFSEADRLAAEAARKNPALSVRVAR